MKVQQAVTAEHLDQLLETTPDSGPFVSMILPMETRGQETRQNPIRLKSALKQARTLLEGDSLASEEIDALLAPAEKLIRDNEFWQNQEATLALYLSRETFNFFVLPAPFGESISVAPRFQVTPLLHAASRQPSAYVLALSKNEVVLYFYERGELKPVEVPDLPADMESALLIDPEQSVQQHAITNSQAHAGPVMGTHGQGGYKDERLGHLKDFLHSVEHAVTRYLESRKASLYLATVEENDALYRQINRYGGLARKSLRGSFERRSKEDLSRKLTDVLESEADEAKRAACTSVADLAGTGAGTTDLDEAIIAASDGRVDTCIIALDAPQRTGIWNPDAREVEHDLQPTPHHVELHDFLAETAWSCGGTVHFALREDLPDNASVAVSYRY